MPLRELKGTRCRPFEVYTRRGGDLVVEVGAVSQLSLLLIYDAPYIETPCSCSEIDFLDVVAGDCSR